MFIDIHAHAYLYPSPPQDGRTQFPTPEDVIKRQDELGIEMFNPVAVDWPGILSAAIK